MCGICGKVSFNTGPIEVTLLKKMCSVLASRGPDDEGLYVNSPSKFQAGLGHRRLSIIDLSEAGHQPMSNESQTIWIVCNGEIYNFKDLRANLESKGHIFKSRSDTEVIIHLYEEEGIDCVRKLYGMFAFAIWDKIENKLFLARDRLGKKPLFYAVRGNSLIFASQIKALLEDEKIQRHINLRGLHNYLTYGYVPAPDTIFLNIKKLLPAHIMIWNKGSIKVQSYWQIDFNHKLSLREEEYCERILELLKEVVRGRLISDVPLGVFLSGGIDSSAISAIMSQCLAGKIKTFSIGFDEKSFDELRYANIIARHFGTEHHEFIVRPEAMKILPELIMHFGEPFADSSAIPTYYLSKLAKAHITVALGGDGGDEIFAGYDRYVANKIRKYFYVFSVFSPLFKHLPESTCKRGMSKRLKRFAESLNLSEYRAYAGFVDIFTEAYRNSLYTDELSHNLRSLDSYEYILSTYNLSGVDDFIDATLYVDTKTYLPNDLLVKADVASMANALEVRSPFLDHRLVEFAAQIPPQFKLKGIVGKYILKKSLTKLLPKQILYRPKSGFGVPVGEWFRKELREYTYNILLDEISIKRGYFRKESVEGLLKEHCNGKFDHGQRIWSLLILELWHRIFMDG
jgi:asparagine synthase (glutamine-hydrolysing)